MIRSLTLALCLVPMAAFSDPPRIVEASLSSAGQVTVTLLHGDTGWDHYADAWEVRLADGTVLGQRILHHPHVTEQPFTRRLNGITVPDGIRTVYVFAKDNLGHWTPDGYAVPVR